jgi:hypothetical protein
MFIKEINIIRIKVLENKGGKKINNIEISKKKLKLQGRPSFTMSE